jgi:predicted Zn-ribbon and HTH transcriptional regulator
MSQRDPIVYVMKLSADDCLYKIGCTDHLDKRYAKRSRDRIVLKISAAFTYFNLGAAIHRLFANCSVQGEIFRLSINDLDLLSEIQKSDKPWRMVGDLLEKRMPNRVVDGYMPLEHVCKECGYSWKSKGTTVLPKECPDCKSRSWQ